MDTTSRTYDCNNPADQVSVANSHKISEATFNGYISAFWGTTNPTPTIKTWAQMSSAMAGQDCTQMRWKLQADEYNLTNNNVTLTIEPIPTHEVIKNYSFALFKGVKEQYSSVTEFHFFKAKKNGQPDLIFKAMNNIGQAVYFGDLSDLHP